MKLIQPILDTLVNQKLPCSLGSPVFVIVASTAYLMRELVSTNSSRCQHLMFRSLPDHLTVILGWLIHSSTHLFRNFSWEPSTGGEGGGGGGLVLGLQKPNRGAELQGGHWNWKWCCFVQRELLGQEKVRAVLSVLRELVKTTRRGDVCHENFPYEQALEV